MRLVDNRWSDGRGVDRAFEAFFSTTEIGRGTGPGLDTARRVGVERHGGSIGITSTPGATTVTALLPLG